MQKVEGFPYVPRADYIFIADYGQPDVTEGGIHLAGYDFGIYRFNIWRYGEIIAIGPGRLTENGTRATMPPELKLGDKIMFSRKHGTRLPGDIVYHHPKIPSRHGLLIRVLDPEKVVAVIDNFDPWWDVSSRQIDPGVMFSG